MKTVGEIIGNREAYCVEPDMTVRQVVDYLCERGTGAVAVCDGDEVIGVFSERDLMRRVVAQNKDPNTLKVRDVMTEDVVCVKAADAYNVAKALMFTNKLRHLAVVDDDHRFKGFVAMRELLETDLAESNELISQLSDAYYDHQFKKPRR